jgi:hypothetical protein
MQKRTLLAALTAAAATAFVMPGVASAQNPPPTPPPSAQPPVTDTAKGEVALQPTFHSLMTSLDSVAAQTARLKALTDVQATNIQLVNVSELVKAETEQQLNDALTKAETDVAALREALGANTTISDALKANSTPLTTADVVATDVTSDGKVIVYYWKKQ